MASVLSVYPWGRRREKKLAPTPEAVGAKFPADDWGVSAGKETSQQRNNNPSQRGLLGGCLGYPGDRFNAPAAFLRARFGVDLALF
jgi:hypothetical protein